MPTNHLILYCPLLLLPSIFASIRGFSNEPAVCIRWPKYRRLSFSISPSKEYSGWFPLRLTGLSSLLSKGLLVCDVCDINSGLQLWIAFLGLFMSLSLPLISAPDGQRWGLTQSSSASVMSAIWQTFNECLLDEWINNNGDLRNRKKIDGMTNKILLLFSFYLYQCD